MTAKYLLVVVLLFSSLNGVLFSFPIEDHKESISGVDGTRIKRNAPEVKYFQLNTPIVLHCFETNRPADDDIIKYEWNIGGLRQSVYDIASDSDLNNDFLEKGDISLTVTNETKERYQLNPAECWAAVKGDPEVHEWILKIKKNYTLLEANGLSGGAIAGIVIGVIVLPILIAVLWKKYRSGKIKYSDRPTPNPTLQIKYSAPPKIKMDNLNGENGDCKVAQSAEFSEEKYTQEEGAGFPADWLAGTSMDSAAARAL